MEPGSTRWERVSISNVSSPTLRIFICIDQKASKKETPQNCKVQDLHFGHEQVWWFLEIWLTRETYGITPDCFFKSSHSSDESLQLLVLVPEFLLLSYDCSQNISDILFHYRWMAIHHASCIHRDTVDRCFSMSSNRLGLGNVFVCCPPCEENLEPVRGFIIT